MKLKDSIKSHLAKFIAGGLISLLSMFFTWAITPVKVIVKIPQTLEVMQRDFAQKQNSVMFAIEEQRKADSAMLIQITELQTASNSYQKEIGTIKTKVSAVAKEFPVLHRRFIDIEEAVANQTVNINVQQPFLNSNHNQNFSTRWKQTNRY